jgi:predicted RNA-binding Zn-ribbon protein involved in translation (DUF1610 family)
MLCPNCGMKMKFVKKNTVTKQESFWICDNCGNVNQGE